VEVHETEGVSSACEPEVLPSQEDSQQNGEACEQHAPNALKEPVEVDAEETLDWKALRWSHPRDTNISTSGEVNINLCREVQDRHIRARAHRLA
jgi:hypothetical protein